MYRSDSRRLIGGAFQGSGYGSCGSILQTYTLGSRQRAAQAHVLLPPYEKLGEYSCSGLVSLIDLPVHELTSTDNQPATGSVQSAISTTLFPSTSVATRPRATSKQCITFVFPFCFSKSGNIFEEGNSLLTVTSELMSAMFVVVDEVAVLCDM